MHYNNEVGKWGLIQRQMDGDVERKETLFEAFVACNSMGTEGEIFEIVLVCIQSSVHSLGAGIYPTGRSR